MDFGVTDAAMHGYLGTKLTVPLFAQNAKALTGTGRAEEPPAITKRCWIWTLNYIHRVNGINQMRFMHVMGT